MSMSIYLGFYFVKFCGYLYESLFLWEIRKQSFVREWNAMREETNLILHFIVNSILLLEYIPKDYIFRLRRWFLLDFLLFILYSKQYK